MISSLRQYGTQIYIFKCCFESVLQFEVNLFCFIVESVIEEDLAPWKNGITEEVFNTAKSNNYGSHYQIVNHKLYREDSCMFPARCVHSHYLHVTAAWYTHSSFLSLQSSLFYKELIWIVQVINSRVCERSHKFYLIPWLCIVCQNYTKKYIYFIYVYVEHADKFLSYFILMNSIVN